MAWVQSQPFEGGWFPLLCLLSLIFFFLIAWLNLLFYVYKRWNLRLNATIALIGRFFSFAQLCSRLPFSLLLVFIQLLIRGSRVLVYFFTRYLYTQPSYGGFNYYKLPRLFLERMRVPHSSAFKSKAARSSRRRYFIFI